MAPSPTGGTHARMHMDYTLKWGLAGRMMDAVMVRRMFRKRLTELLLGLDAHVTTPRAAAA